MAEFPALPLFTDAYLADTRHLTAEEHGAYLLLLMCAWRTRGCALKDCDHTLARIVGVTRPRWRRLKPTLAEFFVISDGLWRQKKLTDVYRGVEARVAKNRANGAKGGRAKAARDKTPPPAPPALPAAAEIGEGRGAKDGPKINPKASPEGSNRSGQKAGNRPGNQSGKQAGQRLPTKNQNQSPKPEAAEAENPMVLLAAAAGLSESSIDTSILAEWQAAGASVTDDMVPTIRRIAAREEKRSGRVPASLAYYSAAVLEARDKRLGAVAAGQAHASRHPAAPPKRVFDAANPDDWRLFLGDASSRFRGDYISQNWGISRNNPHFSAEDLGPDPRHSINSRIPDAVMDEYAARWRWRRR